MARVERKNVANGRDFENESCPERRAICCNEKMANSHFIFFFSLKSVCSRETNIEWVAKLVESVSTNPIDFNGDFFLQRESDATAHRDKLTETP